MSGLGAMLGAAAPGAAATWRLFRRLESAPARAVFLRRLSSRWLLRRQDRLPPLLGPEAQILFVCHGNIMRSALAEVALVRALQGTRLRVASAGTSARPGRPADPRALAYASGAGLDLSRHRARRLDRELALESDLIFALDRGIEAEVASLLPALRERTLLLGGITPFGGYAGGDIDDPFTLAADRATRSFDQVMESVGIVAERLKSSGPLS